MTLGGDDSIVSFFQGNFFKFFPFFKEMDVG